MSDVMMVDETKPDVRMVVDDEPDIKVDQMMSVEAGVDLSVLDSADMETDVVATETESVAMDTEESVDDSTKIKINIQQAPKVRIRVTEQTDVKGA